MECKHSFVKVWLDFLGNDILINGKNFFKRNLEECKQEFKIKPLKTEMPVIDVQKNEEEEIEDIGFAKLKELGYTVYSIPAGDRRWRKNQKSIYVIAEIMHGVPGEIDHTKFSQRSLKLEIIRSKNIIRGVGLGFGTTDGKYADGDITPWVCYDDNCDENESDVLLDYDNIKEKIGTDYIERQLDLDKGIIREEERRQDVKELPVMETEQGELVCMPYDADFVPKMLMVGKTGKGKTLTLNSIAGRVIYIYEDRVGILNDSFDQMFDLMLPMDNEDMIETLNYYSNEPLHLPVINLYLSAPNTRLKYSTENVDYRLVVSFRDLLYRFKFYSYGVGKWDIGKAEKYLSKDVIEGLYKCEDYDAMRRFLYAHFTEKLGKANKQGEVELEDGYKKMIEKWLAVIDKMMKDEFLDIQFRSEQATSAEWYLFNADFPEGIKEHPFIISMYAGAIPIINTAMAKSKPITKKLITDLLNKIPEWQSKMKAQDKIKRVWLAFDEIKDVANFGKRDEIYMALDNLFTQGRFPLIGFIGNIQEYTKLSQSMQTQCSHLLIFEIQSDKEKKQIAKDFNLDKNELDEIKKLNKFECLFTTREKVVTYDTNGRKTIHENGGLWRGKVLPPISTHKRPSDKKGD